MIFNFYNDFIFRVISLISVLDFFLRLGFNFWSRDFFRFFLLEVLLLFSFDFCPH